MPTAVTRKHPIDQYHDEAVEWALAVWAEFDKGWHRTKKGNLWRSWDGLSLTVFRRKGAYHWCIAGCDGPRFSRRGYSSEEGARAACGEGLGLSDV